MHRLSPLALALALTALSTSLAFGQRAHEHRGFWWGVGLGGGVNISEGTDGETLGGYAGTIRVGGTVSEKLLLAGDLTFWLREYSDLDLYRSNTTFSAFWFPIDARGFYVQAGVGLGVVSGVVRQGGGSFTESELAFGTTLGIGLDLRISSNLYITPNFAWLFQAFDEIGETGVTSNSVLVGTLGITTH